MMFIIDNKNNGLLPYLKRYELCFMQLFSTAKLSEAQYVVGCYVLLLHPPLKEYERERERE